MKWNRKWKMKCKPGVPLKGLEGCIGSRDTTPIMEKDMQT